MKKPLVLLLVLCAVVPALMAQTVYTMTIPDRETESNTPAHNSIVTRSGNTYFCDGKSMNKQEYVDFLYSRNPAAWAKAQNGYKLATAGWTLLGVGAGLQVICYTGVLIGLCGTGTASYIATMGIPVWAACNYIGMCCEIACVPTLIVGYTRMHRSADIYNISCTTAQARPYWSVQAGQNGIGLALNF